MRDILADKDKNLYNYNSVLAYQIDDGFLSVNRFRQAIKNVLSFHEIFRTSVDYDGTDHCVKQTINKSDGDNYSYELTCLDVNDLKKVDELIYKEQITKSFDLNSGKIFRCHLLQKNDKDKNRLSKNDYVLLIFHHSAIDEYSKFLFLKELTKAYENQKLNSDANQLRFIDYSHYERQLDLNKAENFWEDMFLDYNFKQKLKLPYDDKVFNSISSGSFYSFGIDKSLTRQIFRYKTRHNITLFRLFLSTFYVYLFKLTQDTDICITGTTTNRYKEQLNNIIGPLENIIVYRFVIDPNKSFNQFAKQIEELCISVKEHGNYPYQKFIANARKFSSIQFPFSQVALKVHIDDDQWVLDVDNNLILKQISLTDHKQFKRDNKLTPVELTLNVKCSLEKQIIEFYFDYSNKLFEEKTIQLLADRYKKILKHLFDVNSTFDLDEEQIYKLSIILSEEETLIHGLDARDALKK